MTGLRHDDRSHRPVSIMPGLDRSHRPVSIMSGLDTS